MNRQNELAKALTMTGSASYSPFDVRGANFLASLDMSVGSGRASGLGDLVITSDGDTAYCLYIGGIGTPGRVYYWTLSTPWDLTTASYSSSFQVPNNNAAYYSNGYAFVYRGYSSYSVLSYETGTNFSRANERLLYYRPSNYPTLNSTSQGTTVLYTSMDTDYLGTRFANRSASSNNISFSSMTSWNIGSTTARGYFTVGNQTSGVGGFCVRKDTGKRVYVVNGTIIYQYDLPEEWKGDLGTGRNANANVIFSGSFDCSEQVSGSLAGVDISDDGKNIYVSNTRFIFQYQLGALA